MSKTRYQGRAMTERIFGPFRDSFDDALSRLEASVAKSETEAERLKVAVEQLLKRAAAVLRGS
jgi:hypothetical protein